MATAEQLALRAGQSASAGNKVATVFQIVGAASLGLLALVQTFRAVWHVRHGEEHHRGR